jgi:hypothetical protein
MAAISTPKWRHIVLRILSTLLIVSILLISSPLAAQADASRLYLPALGHNPTTQPATYGTLFGHAFCASGVIPTGAWLWFDAYSTVVSGDGSWLLIAPVGTVSAIYYGQYAATAPIAVQPGRMYIGTVTLPC